MVTSLSLRRIRRLAPTAEDRLYIVSDVRAKTLLVYGIVTMARRIGPDRVLIGTARDVHNVEWGGRVASYVAEGAYQDLTV